MVSIYLIYAGGVLMLTNKIPSSTFRKILLSKFRQSYAAEINTPVLDEGFCFRAPLPRYLLSDKDSSSCIAVYENSTRLGPGHCTHAEIRQVGCGRYSHWGAEIYFSTSDNSDPLTNGNRYFAREEK
jgi:hypothetical protein